MSFIFDLPIRIGLMKIGSREQNLGTIKKKKD